MLSVELAKSGRAKCRATQQKIGKGEVRVGKEVPNVYTGRRNFVKSCELTFEFDLNLLLVEGVGTTTQWYSLAGTEQMIRTGRMSISSAKSLTGFQRLSASNKKLVNDMLARAKGGPGGDANSTKFPSSPAKSSTKGGGAQSAKMSEEDAKAVLQGLKSSGKTQRGTLATWMEGEPLEQGISCIEYARVKKPSNCKLCYSRIAQGDIRVGDRQPSQFYYGMQTRWLCFTCAKGNISRLSQLMNWDRMGYDVSNEIRAKTNELMSPEKEAALEALMVPVNELWDILLAEVLLDEFIQLLDLNGISATALRIEKRSIDMALLVADAILNGLCEDCPVCKSAGLLGLSGRVVCWGFLGGFTKCVFRSDLDSVERCMFRVPADMAAAEWMGAWLRGAKAHCMVVDDAAPPLFGNREKKAKKKKKKKGKKAPEGDGEGGGGEELGDDEIQGFELSVLNKLKKKELVALAALRGLEAKGTMPVIRAAMRESMLGEPGKAFTDVLPELSSATTGTVMKLECRLRGIKAKSAKAKIMSQLESHHQELVDLAATAVRNSTAMEVDGGEARATAQPSSSSSSSRKRRKGAGGDPITSKAKRLKLKAVANAEGKDSKTKKEKNMKKSEKKEKRETLPRPQAGSPILEVHSRYPYSYNKPSILVSADGQDVYNAVMSEVSLGTGINRFYVVQLLKVRGGGFEIFCHWGRTGSQGAEWAFASSRSDFNIYSYSSRSRAVSEFKKWFYKKTNNEWDERHDFEQKPQCYYYGELSRENKKAIANRMIASKHGEEAAEIEESTLPPETQELVELLFDEDTIIGSMKESGVKVDEMPLGAVTLARIQAGSDTLQQIRLLLESKEQQGGGAAATGQFDERVFLSQLKMLTTMFYNQIPAVDPALIGNQEILQKKADQVNLLNDIAMGQNLLKSKARATRASGGSGAAVKIEHPTDGKYKSLKCDMRVLPKASAKWKVISEYLNNTVKPPPNAFLSGSRYGKKPQILEIFEVGREGEAERFSEHKGLGNRKLLWHGTNIAVVAAILASGLRIMPNAGGRVGRGLYFAAEMNKSAYYVSASEKCGTGIMFLAEVAMGKEFHITKERHSLRKAPKGYDSVVAQGKFDPDPAGDETFLLDGREVTVPTGKPKPRAQYADSNFQQSEYLIYKESQCQLRYMIKLKMT